MILVVIILVAWMIILGPNLLKRRSRTVGGINSISHFHHQLRVLEQSGPQPYVAPAFRLRSVDGSALPSDGGEGSGPLVAPKLSVVGADQLPRPALAFLGRDSSGPEPGSADAGDGFGGTTRDCYDDAFDDNAPGGPSMRPGGPPRAQDAYARQRARRRRRDTLGVLTMVFASTVLIGFVPGASAAWVLSAVSGVALAAYVALLVRMRQAAEERERKLHYLRPGGSADVGSRGGHVPDRENGPYGTGDLPVRVSGRYAHPSNQAAVAH